MLFSKWLPPLLDWPLTVSIIVLLAIVILIYVYQERLIYMPTFPPGSRTDVWTPDRFGMRYETVTVSAADGCVTTNYYIPWRHHHQDTGGGRRKAVVFCHANAGNLGHRLPIIRKIRDSIDVAVFMPSYRGYGKSEGKPDEAGIRMDVQAGLDWFIDRLDQLKVEYDLYAFGQSIGGAVAIDLVARNQNRFAGLIVENTFTSLPDLIPHVLPVLAPMKYLCRQRWPSLERLRSFEGGKVRVLILSGEADLLIPPRHSQLLFEAVDGGDRVKEVKIVKFAKGGHNDTVLQAGYFEAVVRFING